jgi:hypothetical protein
MRRRSLAWQYELEVDGAEAATVSDCGTWPWIHPEKAVINGRVHGGQLPQALV